MKIETHKVAAITDDGITISEHLGKAQYFLVVTIENDQIIQRDLRPKLGRGDFDNEPQPEIVPGQPHGMNYTSHIKHEQIAYPIADCEALLCRGMGTGAYHSMQMVGIRPVVTDIAGIEEAVMAYIEGNITDHTDKLR